MNNEQNTNSADIVISDAVIEKIAKTATLEVDGVVTVTTSLKTDLIDKISKKNHSRGVSIVKEDDDISITISVVIYYDYNIIDVANEIQSKVTDAIEAMTGHNCQIVNINVIGIETKESTTGEKNE